MQKNIQILKVFCKHTYCKVPKEIMVILFRKKMVSHNKFNSCEKK
jgi:hypothetical protein